MRGIVKRFPGVLANDQVDFSVRKGEVHTLLGENGAGKSTLMKILFGLHQPDEGQIKLDGEETRIHSPGDAIRAGIGMIHQHFMLVPTLTVAENVALGLGTEHHMNSGSTGSARQFFLNLDPVASRISEISDQYGLKVDPSIYVWQLSVGEQQRVEIIKALFRNAELLALDEPTAVLTPQEVDDLFVTLRSMTEAGHSLIFISHKLHEVLEISDRITVLRNGRLVGTVDAEKADRPKLAQMMVGREVFLEQDRGKVEVGEPRLQIQHLCADSDRETQALHEVDLTVNSGEIVAIAGVSGNGQRELAEVIAGLRPATAGSVLIDGQDCTNHSPGQLRLDGLAYIPEERMRDGAVKEFSVAENLMLHDFDISPYANRGFLRFDQIKDRCTELIKDFDVKTPSADSSLKTLSGGNIQKAILARELSGGPTVLVAAQPTRGVDIGATEYIRQRLLDQRNEGTATLLISEDLDEIMSLADRIAVMYEGHIMGVVDREDADITRLGLLMAGVQEAETAAA